MAKFIGSNTVAETSKIINQRLAKTDALTKQRQEANKILRGTNTDVQPRTKPKKKRIIKVDPNVQPTTGTPFPVQQIAQTIRSAFGKAKAVAKAGGAKIKEAGEASQPDTGKTVVPLEAKPSRNPFKKQTANTVKVVPQKGFKKLADEQGVPQSQTLNQARGITLGQSGPLPNLVRRRRAAAARKVNLGGTRSDRSRGNRTRGTLSPNPNRTPTEGPKQLVRNQNKDKPLISRKATFALGAAAGLAGAVKRFR